MANNLEELRKSWENGSTVIAEFGSDKNSTVVVVLKNPDVKEREYTVNRYFSIAGKWVISCDANDVSADEAFSVAARGVKIEMDTAVALQKMLEQQPA